MKIDELFPDVISEDLEYEFKAILNPDNPIKWAKTIVGYANGKGGVIFIGVSNDREAFGLTLEDVDSTKNLVSIINDRNIFPHVKYGYMLRSVDEKAEKYVLALKVKPSDSIVRYREGDFNETVFIKGDGNTTPATPEDIISLSKRKYGVDNETSEIKYTNEAWTDYINLCKEYREDATAPSLKEMQNEEVVSKDGYAKSGLLMFKDDYNGDDTLICCRLWRGNKKIGDVIDSDRFKGPLSKVFREAIQFIERNTKTGWRKIKGGGREEIRSYPEEAVREALVNAIAHRDYSIAGTQIDIDIYCNRIDIVSPGSWLLPKHYEEYPIGLIPSIRRNAIIAACLDIANLMERGGTGFQTIVESYKEADETKQPVVLIYPGFLDLRLFDLLYEEKVFNGKSDLTDEERVIELLRMGPCSVKDLQAVTHYKSRSNFLHEILNPLIEKGIVYRDGNPKSPSSLIRLR